MNNRLWRTVTMAVWAALLPMVAVRADDSLFGNVRAQWVPVDVVQQSTNLLREATSRTRTAEFDDPPTGFSRSPRLPARSTASTSQASFEAQPSTKPHRSPWATPARHREAKKAIFPSKLGREAGDRADGTWHEDGRYITINLNGQELKLVKTPPTPVESSSKILERFEAIAKQERPLFQESNLFQDTNFFETLASAEHQNTPEPPVTTNGSVSGRLLHRGRPLARCRVSIVPLQKAGKRVYTVNALGKPFSGTTDEQGNYFFDDVPPGPYKLFWRPVGDRGWTRHIEYRPNFIVRTGQVAHVKVVRAARRTVN